MPADPKKKMKDILDKVRDSLGVDPGEDEERIKELMECIDHGDVETLQPLLGRLSALVDIVPDSPDRRLAKKWCKVLDL